MPEGIPVTQDDGRTCPQCGALWQDGRTCFEKYGEILALEFESPAVFGAVHHITVNCYNIQHPDEFTAEAQEWMRSALRDVIEEGLPPAGLLERAIKTSGRGFKYTNCY